MSGPRLVRLPESIVEIVSDAGEGAQKAADDAKKYAIWGAVIGLVGVGLYVLFFIVIGVAGGF